ncbi:alpha/beta hydrolase-fold protein [Corynebacterium mayonis]|uniref:alpha/beta hydrolase-fold protein n=1 Tax=Corynebacterium mayonis TaxID=3062461 RepID=UPI0031405760
MKITRPAIAAVAAIAIAAGTIPTVSHLTASSPIEDPAVSFEQAQMVPAVDDTTVINTPTSESEAPSEETSTVSESKSTEPTATGIASTKSAAVVPPESSQLKNMPTEPSAAAHVANAPVELTVAPKDYKGNNQEWFEILERIKPVYTGPSPWKAVQVRSASMGRDIPVAVRYATDENGNRVTNAPTIYLLNGAGGSEQNTDWIAKNFANKQSKNGVEDIFGDQGINVVIPMEGAFSYYVNWLETPKQSTYYKGEQKWATFLGEELPASIDPYLNSNGRNAIVGFSMSATSSLLLAEQYPNRFDAVGSFSGCAATSTSLPWFASQLTLNRGGTTPEQLWGPMGSDYNRYNDALVNSEKLRGKAIYVSNGSGLGGETDTSSNAGVEGAFTLQVEGGVIEGLTNSCTHDLRAKLNSQGIPATFKFRNTGTHSWPYWKDDLKESWETVIKPKMLG